ncbi:class I SAM-dependent methyltransferase [Demetria terragena]|uniref:class I SAM-dependent methyltransferase n=1 Tax=Demetria terragena TaxID=63959 RepID=UPI00039B2A04|nr:methyltransferase domain-containing protein [Demetria terragena]
MNSASTATLLSQWRAEEGEQPGGWDFSQLADRMSTDPPPWDLDAEYRWALRGATRVLDMGTGGGEHLLEFTDGLPTDVTATEGWEPNVLIAQKALEPHGIRVVAFGASDDDPDADAMPFPDERFDLVLNRHESYGPHEVARVLASGGVFLTQQVGSGELAELHDLTEEAPADLDVSHERFVREIESAGLTVEAGASSEGFYRFTDIAALVAYLRCVPWEVPDDFSVDRYADALLTLHERAAGGPILLRRRRFWLRARKP